MICPYCHGHTKVTNSRSHNKGLGVWRRRQCLSCRAIWTTTEMIDLSTSHLIVARNKRSEPLERDQLFLSIKDSCSHRKTALSDATAITDTVLTLILAQKQQEIRIEHLIELTTSVLSRFDKVAAAVYKAKYSS